MENLTKFIKLIDDNPGVFLFLAIFIYYIIRAIFPIIIVKKSNEKNI